MKQRTKLLFAVSFLGAGVFITLFSHIEPSGETWLYWFFARVFAETGKFIIPDRSPLYVLYLNLFRWIGYPGSVIAEYIVTSLIVSVSLVILLKRYLGLGWAVFAAVLWLPFLQYAEPPVQGLGLAFSCLGVLVRLKSPLNRSSLIYSYALFILASLMRSIYLAFIAVYLIKDIVYAFNNKGLLRLAKPKLSDFSLLALAGLILWFLLMQSNHPWNNAWVTTTKWFPNNGKNVSDAAYIQHANWAYTLDKYGSFKDKDFYFTNREFLGTANTFLGALKTNPHFVLKRIFLHTRGTFSTIASLTIMPPQEGWKKIILFLPVLLIFFGAFKACLGNKDMLLFIALNIVLVFLSSALAAPKIRYLLPMVPVYILSAYWYASRLSGRIMDWKRALVQPFLLIVFLVIFSNASIAWGQILKDLSVDIKNRDIRIMESRPYSNKSSFRKINPLVKSCRGVLSLEHRFTGAFMDIPLSWVYDVWEIPPFGRLGASSYRGLYPERIDCVLVCNEMVEGIGGGTNHQIRYRDYILPYINELKDKGARVYKINSFGEAVIYYADK